MYLNMVYRGVHRNLVLSHHKKPIGDHWGSCFFFQTTPLQEGHPIISWFTTPSDLYIYIDIHRKSNR